MSKQQREALILAVVLVVLVGLVLWTYVGKPAGKTPPSPPRSTTSQSRPNPRGAMKPTSGRLVWVKDLRINVAVAEVRKGRDPFRNLMLSAAPTESSLESSPRYNLPILKPRTGGGLVNAGGTGSSIPAGGESTGVLPLYGSEVEAPQTSTVTLDWITADAVRKQLAANADLEGVTFKQGKTADQVMVTGDEPAYSKALDAIEKLDVEPPKPSFSLTGVVTVGAKRYAALSADGKYYTLLQGETIPGLGWVVKEITPGRVALAKGKQHVVLMSSGGSK